MGKEGRKGGRKEGRKEGRKGGKEGGRKGGKEGGRKGGRMDERDGGRKGPDSPRTRTHSVCAGTFSTIYSLPERWNFKATEPVNS